MCRYSYRDNRKQIENNLNYHKISFNLLFRITITKVVTNPEVNKLRSSFIPRKKAALNPMIDQRSGIIIIIKGNFLSVHKKNPNVKMVVGHGRPNVGEDGY